MDLNQYASAYKSMAILKMVFTYLIPIVSFLIIILMNIKINNIQKTLEDLKRLNQDKSEM